MTQIADYTNNYRPTWCPGCGNFGMWAALRRALAALDLPPHRLLCVYDIGCGGNGGNWFHAYGFHSLHGRALPAALGCKLANRSLEVICFAGDGGGFGEGGNHFLHTCRTNADFVYVIHDNQLYSLTTGQASPTSAEGMETKSTPTGDPDRPLAPLQLAISAGATWVGRGFSDDLPGLAELYQQAIQHRGFAVLDVLQPCVTFNHLNTREWYQAHTVKLTPSEHDPRDKNKALLLAGEWNGKIPLGVLYRELRPTYEDHFPQLMGQPLTERVVTREVSELLDHFR